MVLCRPPQLKRPASASSTFSPCPHAKHIGDFVGETGVYVATTEEDISIVCGACDVLAEGQDASSASKLLVGFVKAAGAGMLAVASSIGGWF